MIVMYKGEIVEVAATRTIFADPKHPYTKGLLACRPSPEHHLKKLPIVADFLSDTSSRVTIEKIRERYAYQADELKARKSKVICPAAGIEDQ